MEMKESDIVNNFQAQRAWFRSGMTRNIEFRIESLRILKNAISDSEPEILEALRQDMGKPAVEAWLSEIFMTIREIETAVRDLPRWIRPKTVPTPLAHFPAKSRILPEPYGVALILAPWNYPLRLLAGPLIGALAAGNCVAMKPSEIAPCTSSLIARIIRENFDQRHAAVVEGGPETSRALLELPFDYIFYTGGTRIGRLVMEAAAKNLAPVTLELGGKSPCIVDRSTDIEKAARRIAWGKFFNAGQTCVAPDYVCVSREIEDDLVGALSRAVSEFYGEDPVKSPDYARIVNERHFDRIMGIIRGDIAAGGAGIRAEKYIAPTIIRNVSWKDGIMEEEIFGPVLPVIAYGDIDELIGEIVRRPKPLALYLFTDDGKLRDRIVRDIPAGGVCINDTLRHLSNPHLPFGGVGESGMGSYHGKKSFAAFSHFKSIMERGMTPDLPLAYPPYKTSLPALKRIMRWLG
ncbi:MAG: aldehyde dehydrogenase [Syntrophales bacterium]|nr:aldehyde dehydrogenase [Syntrophales bacterium]MDD5233106.1 aldehyde dehydrogenase [Syntrophales bacterium]MDD5532459.1 aldehyde dehydrogenase [Syntrophales bacterium]